MIDKKNIIKGLEIHADPTDEMDCKDCPYNNGVDSRCIQKLCEDALTLLKEEKQITTAICKI